MKFINLLLIALSLLIVSCGGDDDNPTPGNNNDSENSFSCKLDGDDFVRIDLFAYATDWDEGEEYTIYGAGDATKTGIDALTVYLNIPQSLGEGTHAFNDDITFGFVGDFDGDITYTTFYHAGEGEITISSISEDRIEGTFSFTAYDPEDSTDLLQVTDGEFSVEIQ